MSTLGLSPQRCDIFRNTEPITSDVGNPTVVKTYVLKNVPCRFDRERQRTLYNRTGGDMRVIQTVGRLYIDATVVTSPIDEKDLIELEGLTYQIYFLGQIYGLGVVDHYEIDLLSWRSK
jgi:hypothetical protein